MEQHFVLLFACALGTRPDAIFATLSKVHGNRHKIEALNAGVRILIKSRTRRAELERLYDRLKKVLSLRNNYVHALYANGPDGLVRLNMTKVVGSRPTSPSMPVEQLKLCAKKMACLKRDLYDFILAEPWKARSRAGRDTGRHARLSQLDHSRVAQ